MGNGNAVWGKRRGNREVGIVAPAGLTEKGIRASTAVRPSQSIYPFEQMPLDPFTGTIFQSPEAENFSLFVASEEKMWW